MIKRFTLLFVFFATYTFSFAKESIDPTISPSLFKTGDEITVTYDVTGTPLADLPDAWIWVWIPDKNIDAKYNVNPANSDTGTSDNAKFTKTVDAGKTLFSITFIPSDFFVQDISSETNIGMLLKGNDWNNGADQTTDYVTDFWDGSFQIKLTSPTTEPLFVNTSDELLITAETPVQADYELYIDNVLTNSLDNTFDYSYAHTVAETEGTVEVRIVATTTDNSDEIIFYYTISALSPEVVRPAGVVPGINFDPVDDTKVTLCLLAPGKSSVYAVGEFNDYMISANYLLNKDGDYFWIEITGLTPQQEYAFQYLVDEKLYIADPYAELILDPDNDKFIPSSIYPNMKQVPSEALKNDWWNNRFAVFQTGKPAFNWQHNSYNRPSKENLVIYELLVRDFFAENDRNYLNLIDTLSYFKSLGVNAIELMPIQEFGGNNSWGYNPNSMLAHDKAYGTQASLKQFIDAAHAEGIAVIFDIVFNQQDVPNPFLGMWFDYQTFQVDPANPMFNVNATHPFSVFWDINHESQLTQNYMDTTLRYWVNEFQVDGFRFDLSKGFTQTVSTSVDQWGQKDASRIAILKRMADRLWQNNPDTWVILEHFANNTEETELADYGMMLWGNMHWDYKDLGLGIKKNISWTYHGTRGWQNPNVVGYMESHDEERLMYELLENGLSSGSYNIKDQKTAIARLKALAAFFYPIPGPKMLWEFGELAYDQPINLCEDGNIDNGCRVSPKPVLWNYYNDTDRRALRETVAELIKLKTTYPVFSEGQFTITNEVNFLKEITLENKDNITSPSSANEMSVYVIGNFDLKTVNTNAVFPFTGTWYSYFEGGEEWNVTNTITGIELKPGEFKLFVNYPLAFPDEDKVNPITGLEEIENESIIIYPNPTSGTLQIKIEDELANFNKLKVTDVSGRLLIEKPVINNHSISELNLGTLLPGIYHLILSGKNRIYTTHIVKK